MQNPLADLFFLSNEDELVLIDITGEGESTARNKVKDLEEWIKKEKNKIPQYKLLGIVLAHHVEGTSTYNIESGVSLIRKNDALLLLGGLSQIAEWLEKYQPFKLDRNRIVHDNLRKFYQLFLNYQFI